MSHADQWRDPAEVIGQWLGSPAYRADAFRTYVRGRWWDVLARTQRTLLVSREYEHLLIAFRTAGGRPETTYLPMPHPSGIAVDEPRREVLVASTRNPNQIYHLRPSSRMLHRLDVDGRLPVARTLLPVRTDFYPGCLYIHDIALVDGRLYASAAGQNAIVELRGDGTFAPAWWPRSIERRTKPMMARNHLQLNSIAAGASLGASYFTASADSIGRRRPGHRHFPVDERGVLYAGRTREPIAKGLTRPHSARIHDGQVWVLNSGYGELGYVDDGVFRVVCRLPGWTRGLGFSGHTAFVGTSKILPRFTSYAPGLAPGRSVCGVHAIDTRSGAVLGSIVWPAGDQIFAVEPLPRTLTASLPFRRAASRRSAAHRRLFYAFLPDTPAGAKTR